MVLISGGDSGAATLLFDDFDTTTTEWTTQSPGDTPGLTKVADVGNYFGQGTDNMVGRWQDNSTTYQPTSWTAFESVAGAGEFFTLAFEFYRASGSGSLGIGDGILNNDNRQAVLNITMLTTGQLYSVYMLYNNSLAAESYINPVTGLAGSLAVEGAAVFAYNHVTGTWISAGGNGAMVGGDTARFGFFTGNAGLTDVYLDNVRTFQGVLVTPEPSRVLLLGVALMGVLLRRQRGVGLVG